MGAYFYLILGVAAAFGTAFAISTRRILYHTPDTDNELMAYAAAQSPKWRWLSDVNKYGIGKTSMKNATIILLALFQKIMGDKESDHPYVTLAGFAVSASAVLIYLIGANYLGPAIGLFVSLFYLSSIWSWQVALYGGHVNIANVFFLVGVFLVQKSLFHPSNQIYFLFTGICMCCAMFSSASSSKYLIPLWASVFYARYSSLINDYDYYNLYLTLPFRRLVILDLLIIAAIALAIIVVYLIYKNIVRSMYFNRGPSFLKGVIENQNTFNLGYYLLHAKKKLKRYVKVLIWLTGSMLIIINSVDIQYTWPIFAGFIFTFFIFILPHPLKNLRNYFSYSLLPMRRTLFVSYVDYFAKRGMEIRRNFRGGGLPWIPKILWRIVPYHAVIFLSSLLGILVLHLFNGQFSILPIDLAVIAISISPIWWAEITKAPQISRSYSPALIALLLLSGYFFFMLGNQGYVSTAKIIIIIGAFAWNLWKFLSDVYPARMCATRLVKILKRLDIKKIYTYRTNYNKSLVETIPGLSKSEYTPRRYIKPPLEVHYINSINEVRDGWIVIPGTNGKTMPMTGEPEAINDDFRFTKDPVLNKLLDSKDIEKIAAVKLKTYGTSRIWPMECEVFGYMDLVLHEIKPEDVYRGYAWLFHSSKLKLVDLKF